MNNEIGKSFSSVTSLAAIIPDTPIVSIAGSTLSEITTTTTSTTTTPTPTPTPTSFDPTPPTSNKATNNSALGSFPMSDAAAAKSAGGNATSSAASANPFKSDAIAHEKDITASATTNDSSVVSPKTAKAASGVSSTTPATSVPIKIDSALPPTKPDESTSITTFEGKSKDNDSLEESRLKDWDDVSLKKLLDEAYSYKNPRDKENKSEIFLQLLQKAENEKEEPNLFTFRAITSRYTRNSSSSTTSSSSHSHHQHNHHSHHSHHKQGGSLQDLVDAARNDSLLLDCDYNCGSGGQRNRNRHNQHNSRQKKYSSSVSSRQREGGSLPSNVNVTNCGAVLGGSSGVGPLEQPLFMNEVEAAPVAASAAAAAQAGTADVSGACGGTDGATNSKQQRRNAKVLAAKERIEAKEPNTTSITVAEAPAPNASACTAIASGGVTAAALITSIDCSEIGNCDSTYITACGGAAGTDVAASVVCTVGAGAGAMTCVEGGRGDCVIEIGEPMMDIQQQQQIQLSKAPNSDVQSLSSYYEQMDGSDMRIPRANIISSVSKKMQDFSPTGGQAYVDEGTRFSTLQLGLKVGAAVFGADSSSSASNASGQPDSKFLPIDDNYKSSKSVLGSDKGELAKAPSVYSTSKTISRQFDENGNSVNEMYQTQAATAILNASTVCGSTTSSTSSALSGLGTKGKTKKKSQQERNTKTVDVESVAGYRGKDPVEELVKYIESENNKGGAGKFGENNKRRDRKNKDREKDRDREREKEHKQQQHKMKKSNSLEELRSCSKIEVDNMKRTAATTECDGVMMRNSSNNHKSGKNSNKNNSGSTADINKNFDSNKDASATPTTPTTGTKATLTNHKGERRSWGTEELQYLGGDSSCNSTNSGNEERAKESSATGTATTAKKLYKNSNNNHKEGQKEKDKDKEKDKEKEKEKEIVDKEVKEKDVKEKDVKEKDVKEKDVKEKDVKEKDIKEKDIKEKDVKEKDVKEKDIKEKDIKEKDVKEKDVKEKDVKEKDVKEKDLKEKDLKEKDLKEKDVKEPRDKIIEKNISETAATIPTSTTTKVASVSIGVIGGTCYGGVEKLMRRKKGEAGYLQLQSHSTSAPAPVALTVVDILAIDSLVPETAEFHVVTKKKKPKKQRITVDESTTTTTISSAFITSSNNYNNNNSGGVSVGGGSGFGHVLGRSSNNFINSNYTNYNSASNNNNSNNYNSSGGTNNSMQKINATTGTFGSHHYQQQQTQSQSQRFKYNSNNNNNNNNNNNSSVNSNNNTSSFTVYNERIDNVSGGGGSGINHYSGHVTNHSYQNTYQQSHNVQHHNQAHHNHQYQQQQSHQQQQQQHKLQLQQQHQQQKQSQQHGADNRDSAEKSRRKSTSSMLPSEKSDSSDLDSVHSLPIEGSAKNKQRLQKTTSTTTKTSAPTAISVGPAVGVRAGTPEANVNTSLPPPPISYADIARINKEQQQKQNGIIDAWPTVEASSGGIDAPGSTVIGATAINAGVDDAYSLPPVSTQNPAQSAQNVHYPQLAVAAAVPSPSVTLPVVTVPLLLTATSKPKTKKSTAHNTDFPELVASSATTASTPASNTERPNNTVRPISYSQSLTAAVVPAQLLMKGPVVVTSCDGSSGSAAAAAATTANDAATASTAGGKTSELKEKQSDLDNAKMSEIFVIGGTTNNSSIVINRLQQLQQQQQSLQKSKSVEHDSYSYNSSILDQQYPALEKTVKRHSSSNVATANAGGGAGAPLPALSTHFNFAAAAKQHMALYAEAVTKSTTTALTAPTPTASVSTTANQSGMPLAAPSASTGAATTAFSVRKSKEKSPAAIATSAAATPLVAVAALTPAFSLDADIAGLNVVRKCKKEKAPSTVSSSFAQAAHNAGAGVHLSQRSSIATQTQGHSADGVVGMASNQRRTALAPPCADGGKIRPSTTRLPQSESDKDATVATTDGGSAPSLAAAADETAALANRPAVIILNDDRSAGANNDFTFGDFNEDELRFLDDNEEDEPPDTDDDNDCTYHQEQRAQPQHRLQLQRQQNAAALCVSQPVRPAPPPPRGKSSPSGVVPYFNDSGASVDLVNNLTEHSDDIMLLSGADASSPNTSYMAVCSGSSCTGVNQSSDSGIYAAVTISRATPIAGECRLLSAKPEVMTILGAQLPLSSSVGPQQLETCNAIETVIIAAARAAQDQHVQPRQLQHTQSNINSFSKSSSFSSTSSATMDIKYSTPTPMISQYNPNYRHGFQHSRGRSRSISNQRNSSSPPNNNNYQRKNFDLRFIQPTVSESMGALQQNEVIVDYIGSAWEEIANNNITKFYDGQ